MPTRYRICVKGQLDASWSDRMAGLSITTDRDLAERKYEDAVNRVGAAPAYRALK